MDILLAGIFYLLISEPGLAVYPVLDRPPSQVVWGAAFRARIPVSAHDVIRFRADALSRTPPVPNTPEVDRDNYIPMSLDYLRHGRDWDTRWYWGVGVGWIWRTRTMPDLSIVTADSATGSVILGRALSVGKGQVVFEGRLELEAIEGGVSPAVAFSVGYRHHFTFK
jgi:hypothetical protein